jgi:hypothetical protein
VAIGTGDLPIAKIVKHLTLGRGEDEQGDQNIDWKDAYRCSRKHSHCAWVEEVYAHNDGAVATCTWRGNYRLYYAVAAQRFIAVIARMSFALLIVSAWFWLPGEQRSLTQSQCGLRLLIEQFDEGCIHFDFKRGRQYDEDQS